MTEQNKSFTVVGGDTRSIEAANRLYSLGFRVKVFAFRESVLFSNGITVAKSLREAINDSDYILLPLPYTTNGETLNTPLFNQTLLLSDVFTHLDSSQTVFAGKTDEELQKKLQAKGILYYDYATRDEFAVLNAVPTAEGAIEIALRKTPYTLNDSECLILGYGRIAKMLLRILQGFDARITVAARRKSDLAWISSFGARALPINDIKRYIHQFKIVFNTVPHLILTKDILLFAEQKPLIIDLASRPGGVDFDAAKEMNIETVHALSLPGKVAPTTAGHIICDTILNIICEMEVKQ
ncbi:MAG: dipicolinate synthase subunit DpsA [Ruminococcaceae bacterium]|nr:dipicolinate synthase subunit DpsA [Oscillospiraceae bacterium]